MRFLVKEEVRTNPWGECYFLLLFCPSRIAAPKQSAVAAPKTKEEVILILLRPSIYNFVCSRL